jgi:hypothetical protein
MATVGDTTSAAEHLNALFGSTDSTQSRAAASKHLLSSASGDTHCVCVCVYVCV